VAERVSDADKLTTQKRLVAYFPWKSRWKFHASYSGGLGVLAGDTIRAAADLKLPMVAISLLYRKGFFTQVLSDDGVQTEEPVEWRVEDFLKKKKTASPFARKPSRRTRAWRYDAVGARGHVVPIYF